MTDESHRELLASIASLDGIIASLLEERGQLVEQVQDILAAQYLAGVAATQKADKRTAWGRSYQRRRTSGGTHEQAVKYADLVHRAAS